MKKAIVIGITLGALLALAAPAYGEGGGYPVAPILPVSEQAMDNNQAGFAQTDVGDYYLWTGVEVSVPLHATNLNGFGMLNDDHASPPWRQEGYTPIWAIYEE